MGTGWRGVGALTGFLILFLTSSTDPVNGGPASPSPRRWRLVKGESSPVSSVPKPLVFFNGSSGSNGTRNSRQVPEIPALYSAPKLQTPEIPALYSAPEFDPDSQNEVDFNSDQGRVTTEMTMDTESAENKLMFDETSSEDYQYGVPTEKLKDFNQEEEAFNEYPTDTPQSTSRTNEVEDENMNPETYNSGYGAKIPSLEYGPPATQKAPSQEYGPPQQAPSQEYGPPQPSSTPSSPFSSPPGGYPTGSSEDSLKNEQIENGPQPMTQVMSHNDKSGEGSQSPFYLPPVYTPPQQNQQSPAPTQADSTYNQNLNQYQQPPNPNYQTLPPRDSSEDNIVSSSYGPPLPSSSTSSEGYTPARDSGNSRPQEFTEQRPGIFSPQQQPPPQQFSSSTPSPSQQDKQGQYFGRDVGNNNQPSSFYGPPDINHFGPAVAQQDDEEELEGLNEKIVDTELLRRVQQIIEEHERQQKDRLDKLQADNEKAFSSGYSGSGGAAGPNFLSNIFNGNERNRQTGVSAAPQFNDYSPEFNEILDSNHNNNRGIFAMRNPFVYGPPQPLSVNSVYTSSPFEQHYRGRPIIVSARQNGRFGGDMEAWQEDGISSSRFQPTRGYININSHQPNQRGDTAEPKKLSTEVEFQKAVLSTHFTETQPDPGYTKTDHSPNTGHDEEDPRLNSVSGPGQEYLPPPANPKKAHDLQRNSQNGGSLPSFASSSSSSGNPPTQTSNQNGRTQNGGQERDTYTVKVGAGIVVTEDAGNSGSSGPSFSYGPPKAQNSSPLTTPQHQGTAGEFHGRQDGSSLPGVFQGSERFPPHAPQTTQQQQQQFFPSSPQSPTPNPTFQSRPSLSPQSPTRSYGPPTPSVFYLPQQQPSREGHVLTVGMPSPVYGVPLAPVITIDSDNNIPTFNGAAANHGDSGKEEVAVGKFSPDVIKTSSAPYSLNHGQFTPPTSPPNSNYLPPSSQFNSAAYSSPGTGISQQDLSNSVHFQLPSSSGVSYGVVDNNPSSSPSSSSAYLSIQGHNGNNNNHIYNINHNGYASSGSVLGMPNKVRGSGADSSSIIIPGVSNTFALPIYDYSPTAAHQNLNDQQNVGTTSTSNVVAPFEQLLEQLPHNYEALADPSSDDQPPLFYDAMRKQDTYRLSRRALSKKASIIPAPNPNQKELSGTVVPTMTASTNTTTSTDNQKGGRRHTILIRKI